MMLSEFGHVFKTLSQELRPVMPGAAILQQTAAVSAKAPGAARLSHSRLLSGVKATGKTRPECPVSEHNCPPTLLFKSLMSEMKPKTVFQSTSNPQFLKIKQFYSRAQLLTHPFLYDIWD
jgi:hypothetical protein